MGDYIVHKAVELSAISKAARAKITETEWIISPKYDGCHAIFLFDGGNFIGALSRTGEPVRSMDHIGRSLLDLYPIGTGRTAICGEAWMIGEEFNVISGTFRRHEPQPQLQFVPFDIVPFDYGVDMPYLGQLDGKPHLTPYANRLGVLTDLRATTPSHVLFPNHFGHNKATLEEAVEFANGLARHYKARTDSFFDGAVLAQANGKYSVGSGKGGEFIKCKPLLSYSVKVGAVIADVGAKTGKHTCVLCFDLDGHVQKVSTGLTQEQANSFVENPNLILDQIIEVEAMGKTVNGFLREPRFKGIRIDA